MNHVHRVSRIGAIALAVVATGTLAGCTFGNRGIGSNNGQGGTINFNTDNGTGQLNIGENGVSITGNDGNSTATFGQGLPANWPSDLPTPDSSTLTFGGSSDDEDGTSFSAIYTSNQSVEDAVNDMKSKLQAAGWTLDGDYNSNYSGTTSSVIGASKGENTASVLIGNDSSQPGVISITVGANYKN